MAEISTQGYQDVRDHVQANWKYIELRDGSGTPILRKDIADARVTWTHTAGAQTLELRIILPGTATELGTLPKTVASSAVFNVASGGTAFSVETFTAFTFEATADELTIKHQIQVPIIP